MLRFRAVRLLTICVLGLALIAAGCSKSGSQSQGPAPQGQAPAEETKPVELKMVMFLHENATGNFTKLWLEKVDKYANGRIKINVIGGPEAIPASDQIGAVQQGVVDIANALYWPANSLVPGFNQMGDAEYSPAQLRQRGAVSYIQELFKPHGLYYLGNSSPSAAQEQATFYFKTKAVRKPEDFKGLKIATSGGQQKDLIEALGGSALSIPFTEYYTALERGVADGYFIGTPGITAFGLVPVTRYWLDEPLGSGSAGFFVNLKTWESLSPDLQDALTKATVEFEVDAEQAWNDLIDKCKQEAQAGGVEIVRFSPEDSARFYQLARQKSIEENYASVGDKREVLDKLIELTLDDNFHRLKGQR
ncbi:MAG: TRAP transporter substrate-binding protein DctP [Clostridia bacterium]|jgi:TRAP-type C4-dicarboxylate transport system substrate-binding protein|nr:TRAP transporter substrate-binding protein DctP [Clostridia bacterium]MDH7573546.1 TRAP transporter substrate-binding protein DctP [Clostridia bacterium]